MSDLKAIVHVQDENGTNHVFGPGDDIPEWAAAKITNPKAWADVESDEDRAARKAAEKEAKKTAEVAKAVADAANADANKTNVAENSSSEEVGSGIPKKVGVKKEVWIEYARQAITAKGLQIEIPADAKLKDIFEALEGAGIPTE